MLPEFLEKEKGKNHWYDADAFQPERQNLIQSFMHINYHIGMHTHDFWELNVVMNGRGGHYIGKNRFEIKVGDVFVIPPNVQHGYYNLESLHVYHMLIHASFIKRHMQALEKYSGYASLFEVEPYLRGTCRKSLFLNLSDRQIRELQRQIDYIRIYEESECEYKQILINAAAQSLLMQLCFLAEHYAFEGEQNGLRSGFGIMQCLNYIHVNYDRRLTVEELAALCHMSRASFVRNFQESCGVAPHQYVLQLRVRMAKKLMAESAMSFTEAAHECGFYDAAHLRKMLQKENQLKS